MVIDALTGESDVEVSIIPAEVWVIGGLADVVIGVGVDMLTDAEIITSEFVVAVACDVDVLTAVWAVAITGVVIDNAVDVSVDMDVNSLTAVVNLLELVLSSPSKEAIPLC